VDGYGGPFSKMRMGRDVQQSAFPPRKVLAARGSFSYIDPGTRRTIDMTGTAGRRITYFLLLGVILYAAFVGSGA
jgi:hypothetical protein